MLSRQLIRTIDSGTKRKIVTSGVISSLLAVSLVVSIGLVTWNLWPGSNFPPHSNSPVFVIENTVAQDFADYVPYDESFTLNSPQYTISPGLANVVNIGQFPTLTEAERNAIQTNGFVAIPQSEFKQIYEILENNEDDSLPSFVSSDSVLHAFHILYDIALRKAEVYSFWDLLGNLTLMLLDTSYDYYLSAPEGRWKDASLRNVIYFSVVAHLLDNTTVLLPEVQDAVSEVIALMEIHGGFSDEWFMEYDEDFSQYVPRGHYTRSETLSKYFLAMMWLGRITFRLLPYGDITDNEKGMDETAQAILLALALQEEVSTLPEGTIGYDVWDAIYQPTVFFVGAADDLLPTEYLSLIGEVYGSEIDFDDLNDDLLLEDFIEEALALRDPQILSSRLYDYQDMNQTKGLRVMGQRYIPDSYILGQLVYVYVDRFMPSGLDVMAAFGSERAWELLDDQKHLPNYIEQMEMLQDKITNLTEDDWTQNLYYLWLYSLLPLLNDPGEGYPLFMQSDAWVDKQLTTALASWTELRHDTILYAKQSYTWEFSGMPPDVHGYVEPVPRVYSRLASLCRMMKDGLDQRTLLPPEVSWKLGVLEEFLIDLRDISIKELSGEALNATDIDLISDSGTILAEIVMFPQDDEIFSDADDRMAIIADVHTDANSLQVLEEAVGDPMIILVAVPVNGQVVLTKGGTFSYYEFTQPMDDRLTDEAWQDMLDTGAIPAMPTWTSSFVVGGVTENQILVASDSDLT